MNVSEILNILLGGSALALLVGVITLKATVRKANAEAEKARADADGVRITNTENATRILVENIVKPLKEELHATREELHETKREMASTKREMQRLRKAVESATNCPHSDDLPGCPVLRKLRDNQKDTDRDPDGVGDGAELRTATASRHGGVRNKRDKEGTGAGEQGGDEHPP